MSKQLQTHPSPNPTLTLTCFHVAIVGYGKELMRNYPDAENDPNVLRFGPTYLFLHCNWCSEFSILEYRNGFILSLGTILRYTLKQRWSDNVFKPLALSTVKNHLVILFLIVNCYAVMHRNDLSRLKEDIKEKSVSHLMGMNNCHLSHLVLQISWCTIPTDRNSHLWSVALSYAQGISPSWNWLKVREVVERPKLFVEWEL